MVAYLEIRVGDLIDRSQKFQGKGFLFIIIGDGKPLCDLSGICFLKLLQVMFPGHSFLAVLAVI